MDQSSRVGRSKVGFIAYLTAAEILITIAISKALLSEYAIGHAGLGQVVTRVLRAARSGHGSARTYLVCWLVTTIAFVVLTVLRLRLPTKPVVRPPSAEDTPVGDNRRQSRLLALCAALGAEVILTAVCSLFMAHAAGFQWGFGVEGFMRCFLRGLWSQGGLAPTCYPVLLVWGIGSAFLAERSIKAS